MERQNRPQYEALQQLLSQGHLAAANRAHQSGVEMTPNMLRLVGQVGMEAFTVHYLCTIQDDWYQARLTPCEPWPVRWYKLYKTYPVPRDGDLLLDLFSPYIEVQEKDAPPPGMSDRARQYLLENIHPSRCRPLLQTLHGLRREGDWRKAQERCPLDYDTALSIYGTTLQPMPEVREVVLREEKE